MTQPPGSMAGYKCYRHPEGIGFHFYCQLSGAHVCTTRPIPTEDENEALLLAWETEGKQEFNYCPGCGRWASDMMFNADVLMCVDCVPWEDKPRFCPRCGGSVTLDDRFCTHCGAKLHYGSVL